MRSTLTERRTIRNHLECATFLPPTNGGTVGNTVRHQVNGSCLLYYCSQSNAASYASPSSGDAYSDPLVTPNFEHFVEIFCVPTCFPMRIQKSCLSVRTPRKEIYPPFKKVEIEFWLVLKCWNHPSFVNISPTLVIDTSMEMFSWVPTTAWNLKIDLKKMLTLVFLLSCFVNIFYLILCTLIGLLSHAIHEHSCRSQHISVFTTCTFMFRQVCTIGPSFFNTTSGMHRRPFEGRHLVWKEKSCFIIYSLYFKKIERELLRLLWCQWLYVYASTFC